MNVDQMNEIILYHLVKLINHFHQFHSFKNEKHAIRKTSQFIQITLARLSNICWRKLFPDDDEEVDCSLIFYEKTYK